MNILGMSLTLFTVEGNCMINCVITAPQADDEKQGDVVQSGGEEGGESIYCLVLI